MNINHITIVGRVVRDPELKTMTNGNSVVNMSIATSRVWYNKETKEKQEKAEFHNTVAYGKTADIMGQYCTKGQLVAIEGRLETRSWVGKDEIRKYKTEIIVEKLQLGPKPQAKTETTEPEEIQVDPGYVKKEPVEDLPVLEEEGVEETKTQDDIPF